MRDAPQHSPLSTDIDNLKILVSTMPDGVARMKREEGGWIPTITDEDSLRQFITMTNSYYKIQVPRNPDSWTRRHRSNIEMAMQKRILFLCIESDRIQIHYR